MGLAEKIAEIEQELKRTQINKATEKHIGGLKARLARYKSQLIDGADGGGAKGDGFEVEKSGDARAVLVGFPSGPAMMSS